jgi:hypothetical protein
VPNMKLVTMQHPDLDHGDRPLPVTTMQAFDDVWEPKGWTLADDAVLDAEALEGKNVAQLRKLAANQGIQDAASLKKPELIAALTAGLEG